MSESGCLHNNKYESIEVENRIESNKYTVTEEIHVKSYQMSGDPGGKLSTAVMYSCGGIDGKYNAFCNMNTSTSATENQTAEGSHQQNPPMSTSLLLLGYNNYFMAVEQAQKLGDGKIDFTNSSSTYTAFVQWPPNSILYDLTIIPSRDIQTVGPAGYTGTAEEITALRNNCELVVNLFTVDTSPSALVEKAEDNTSFGAVHGGTYPTYDRASYLIREFPILAAPAPTSKSRWFKHTPLCVVREGGLPMEIVKPNSTVLHQHSTSSTGTDSGVVVINHGSGDTNTSTIPSGKGDDTSAINRSNGSNEPWTDFSFNNIQRRAGASRSGKLDMIKDFHAFPVVGAVAASDKSISKMGQFYNHSGGVGLMLNIGSNNSPTAGINKVTGVEIPSSQGSDSFVHIGSTSVGDGIFANIQFKAIFTFKTISP